ncbi:MAG: hypothetical protein ACLFVQ_11355 [Chitinispirillaceae bacterium]
MLVLTAEDFSVFLRSRASFVSRVPSFSESVRFSSRSALFSFSSVLIRSDAQTVKRIPHRERSARERMMAAVLVVVTFFFIPGEERIRVGGEAQELEQYTLLFL